MHRDNVIVIKSYNYALDVIKVCRHLKSDKEFELSKQFLRCGTSVGANIQEAQGAQSKKDFIHKMSIAYKESRESIYWLNLLIDSNIIKGTKIQELKEQAIQITKLLTSIIKTSKKSI